MGRVYLKFEHRKWKEVEHSDFYLDKFLKRKLDNLKMIQKKDWDGVIIVDGKERSGKSILGMLMGWYLSNCKLGINNFARGLKDASRKIASLPDKSILIMDEGSTVFSSKDSMTKAQKQLVKLMDVVGQKNMIFIICLPCYFDLNKTIAVRRSLFLCHVYPDKKYNRGRFAFWGEKTKKALYKYGKLNFDSYRQPNPEFVAEYLEFKPPFYEEYLEKVKKESLQAVMEDAIDDKVDLKEELIKTEALIYGHIRFELNHPVKEIMKIKNQSQQTISNRLAMYEECIAPNL